MGQETAPVNRGRRAGGLPPGGVSPLYTAQPTVDSTDRRCQLDRVTVLIDGFNLYHGLKAESGRKWLWLDLEKLSESLLKSGQQLVTVRYFTAAVRKDAEGGRRQDTYPQALGAHCPRVQVHLGRFQQRRHRCPSCQELRRTFEEKETDVSLDVRPHTPGHSPETGSRSAPMR